MLRRLLERLVRNRTITRRIRVKGRRGPIVLSPDARLSDLAWSFDTDLLTLAERHLTPGGATRLLTDIRPKMYIETSGSTLAAVLALMDGHGFSAEQHGKNYLFMPNLRPMAAA